MYKTKLQELCQRQGWELPEYTTLKVGPDHIARFTATVKVKGNVFETIERCNSSKEAQNTAAHIAFEYFNVTPPARVNTPVPAVPVTASISTVSAATQSTLVPRNFPVSPLPSSLPIPSPGLFAAKSDGNIKSANREAPSQNCEDSTQASMCYRKSIGPHDKSSKDTLHIYKNLLQQYGQKNSLGFPVYTCEAVGPPHNRCFKARVSLDGKSYETLEFFTTLKEAEQATAKVTCQMLSIDAIQEDGGLYKNLLQKLAQKMGLPCPSYETANYGLSHRPVFVSTVKIGTDTFRGAEAFTKKQAEMNAAKVAYFALTEQIPYRWNKSGSFAGCRAKESTSASSFTSSAINDNFTQSTQPSDVVKQHQDATDEEVQPHAKMTMPGDNIGNTHSPGRSNGYLPHDDSSSSLFSSEMEHSSVVPFEPFKVQAVVEGQTKPQVKTVVFPRKLSARVPKNASMKTYSDEQFVAYRVELKPEPNA